MKYKSPNKMGLPIKDALEAYKSRVKDSYTNKKDVKQLMIKIFSTASNTWFHDLMNNGKDRDPPYWHVFLETNSRFADAFKCDDKSVGSVERSLKQFVEKWHPIKLTSDDDTTFKSKRVLQYLHENDVQVQVVPDQNHGALGTINRFIRTLRDLNQPREGDGKDSTDDEFKWISPNKMVRMLNTYNNTYHDSIKCTPNEMISDPEIEKHYVSKMMKLREKQQQRDQFEMKRGTKVRLLSLTRPYLEKKRYRWSPEYYIIGGHDGLMYKLISADNKVIIRPRYLIRKLNSIEKQRLTHAKTIPHKPQDIEEIVIREDPENPGHGLGKYRGKYVVESIPSTKLQNRFNL